MSQRGRRDLKTGILTLLLVGTGLTTAAAADFEADLRPILEAHCYDCHAGRGSEAGFDFSRWNGHTDVHRDPERWEHVYGVVRDRLMPPPADSTLAEADRQALLEWLRGTLDERYATMEPDPGRVVMRRLTQGEFNNTIRDLLGVSGDHARHFPADGGGGSGFSNTADTLFMPPLLVEKLSLAIDEVLRQVERGQLVRVEPAGDEPRQRALAVKAHLEWLMPLAWRRPVDERDIKRIIKYYIPLEERGVAFEDSIRFVTKIVLMSPNFMYRVEERQRSRDPYLVDGWQMASRLSYFLWSSMPDAELFELAEAGTLNDPQVLTEQVRRMLADPKAQALGATFAVQWLKLQEFANGAGPDRNHFPELDEELRASMLGEPVAFFNRMVADNRPLTDFITSDWTMVDARLARHYGLSGGAGWQKVALRDERRGGVLGMAAVLAATSHPQRTSPVLRGVWVLDTLLNAPPPPPPPNVPSLDQQQAVPANASIREQTIAHQSVASCRSCHSRIDPVGFGLENFDALGRWRNRDGNGNAIDPAGSLPDGRTFSGPSELRQILIADQEVFLTALCENLMAYALGRGIEGVDRPVIQRLVAHGRQEGATLPTLIEAVATAYPFRYSANR